MKHMFYLGMILAVLTLASTGTLSKSQGDLPPGVSAGNWIPISETIGIKIANIRGARMSGVVAPKDLHEEQLNELASRGRVGTAEGILLQK